MFGRVYDVTMQTRIRPIDLVDVLVYLVVLGTFTELFPAVISETFMGGAMARTATHLRDRASVLRLSEVGPTGIEPMTSTV